METFQTIIINKRIKADLLAQLIADLLKDEETEDQSFGVFLHLDRTKYSLLMGKAWLGKFLGSLGKDTPYKNDGKRKGVQDIEPPSEHKIMNETSMAFWFGMPSTWWVETNLIEKVDWLRQVIQEEFTQYIIDMKEQRNPPLDIQGNISSTNAYNYFCEARFHLGFQLEHMKKADDNFEDMVFDKVAEANMDDEAINQELEESSEKLQNDNSDFEKAIKEAKKAEDQDE